MIGVRYIDELFAIYRIPREFWSLISEDLRYDGRLRQIEGFVILLLIPTVFGLTVANFGIMFDGQFYSLLIAAATLFVGFSMNSVLLLLRYSSKEDASPLLIDQTRNLISYLLYLGVLLAFLGMIGYTLTLQNLGTGDLLMIFVSAVSAFSLSHFLIVVLFLPARIFTIIEQST